MMTSMCRQQAERIFWIVEMSEFFFSFFSVTYPSSHDPSRQTALQLFADKVFVNICEINFVRVSNEESKPPQHEI